VAGAIAETMPTAILDFVRIRYGIAQVAFEQSTRESGFNDLIRPNVANVAVCDPKRITGRAAAPVGRASIDFGIRGGIE